MKSCWGYIHLSWLLENIKISRRFRELSPADAFRRWILAVCGKRHLYVTQLDNQLTKIRTFHTEIITTCHSSNVPFYQLVNTRAGAFLYLWNFVEFLTCCFYGGVKFGMVWTPCHQVRDLLISPYLMYSKTQISNFATRGEASYLQLEKHMLVYAIQIYWPHLRDGPMWEWGAKPNPQTLRTRKQLERDSNADLLTNIGQHPSFVHFEFLSRT